MAQTMQGDGKGNASEIQGSAEVGSGVHGSCRAPVPSAPSKMGRIFGPAGRAAEATTEIQGLHQGFAKLAGPRYPIMPLGTNLEAWRVPGSSP
jgi:hypothetical protein